MATPDFLKGIGVDMGTLIRKKQPDPKRMVDLPDQGLKLPTQLPATGADTGRTVGVPAATTPAVTPAPASGGAPTNNQDVTSISKPTVATANQPVIKRTPPQPTAGPQEFKQADYSYVDGLDKMGLGDFVDYYTIKQNSGGKLTEDEQRQLMRAQRRYGDMAMQQQQSTAIEDQMKKTQAEKDAKAAQLAAQTQNLVTAKQNELDAATQEEESNLRSAGQREMEAAQSVLSFSGFGRSTYSAQQQADIQKSTEASTRTLKAKQALELEKYKAEQMGADAKLLESYDKQISDLSLAQAKYLADTATKINEYNQKTAASYQDKISDLLEVAAMDSSPTDLSEEEMNKAKVYGELLIDEAGNLNGEMLKGLPARLRSTALQEAAKAKGAIPKKPQTVTDGAGNTLQYNPKTGLFDIPVGQSKPQAADTVSTEDANGNKITMQWNPETGKYDIPVNAPGSSSNFSGDRTTLDARTMADKYPNQAWAKNNNPAGLTWNSNFDNPQPGTTAYALQQAGVKFSKGTARPANEGGNYVSFDNLGDGMAAYDILWNNNYADLPLQKALDKRGTGNIAGIDQYKNTPISQLPENIRREIQMKQIQKESPGLAKLIQSNQGGGEAQPDPNKFPQYASYIENGKLPVGMKDGSANANKFIAEAEKGYLQKKEQEYNAAGLTIANPDAFASVVTDANKIKAVNNAVQYIVPFQNSMDKLIALVDEYGTEARPGNVKQEMRQLVKDSQLQAKEIYNLGVLNGPDLSLMESIIVNPLGRQAKVGQLFGAGVSYSQALKNAKQTIMDNALKKAESIGLAPKNQSQDDGSSYAIKPGKGRIRN